MIKKIFSTIGEIAYCLNGAIFPTMILATIFVWPVLIAFK